MVLCNRFLTTFRRRTATLIQPLCIAGLVLATATGLNGAISTTVSAAPAQLVNADLEQTTGGIPNCFEQAGWGTHTAAWSLVNGARSGSVAQSVTVSNYQSGDRKLMMSENDSCAPAVTPGATYKLSVWYKSTSAVNALTVFRHSAAGWTYWTDISALPAAAAWTQAAGTTPAIPPGTDQISFGISIAGNGTLVTDDYGFAQTGSSTSPTAELSANPGLEDGGNPPAGWFLAGWGDAKVTSGVTADARSGSRAYAITLSGRSQGDYKLLPAETASPAVQPGQVYQLSAWYKSSAAANNITIFSHTAAGWGYWTDLQTLPATAGWTNATVKTPAIPAGVDAIAWGISISADGTLVTDDYSTTQSAAVTPPATGAGVEGQWTVLDYPLPVRAIHSTVMKNGKVLLIAGSGNSPQNFAAGSFKAAVWDPVSGNFTTLDVPVDMFCAGHATLPDGRVLIQGGTKSYPTAAGGGANYGGLRDSYIFNPDDNTFTATNLANEGHWYPTITEMGNGDMWMAGGLKEDASGAVNTERFSATTNQWLPTWQIPQTWSFWGLYPHMFLMADGRMFYSGGHVFGNGLPGSGASVYDPENATIADVQGLRQKDMRDQSASVLLPPAQDQKVMITGGGNINTANPGINLTDIIDLTQPVPAYQPGPDLPGQGKMYLNATTLPDRTVLVTNGGQLNRDNSTNIISAAIYNPASNAWTSVAADPIGRNYHSSAVLLPDGRVAVFGSNPGDGSFELRISLYDPGYLFRTARPQITNVPAQATYGQQFSFNANIAAGKTIKWAQLTKPMSVTHQMDSNMRLVDLPVVVNNGTATVSVTTNRNLLPPGPYMLSVTDSDGVPSQAAWVMVK